MTTPRSASSLTPLYAAQNLCFEYLTEGVETSVLRKVDLFLQEGCFVCLAGPSGSGKTTLLNILGLIETLQQGSLTFLGRDLKTITEKERNRIRLFELGFVFQSFNLFPTLTAFENVEYFVVRQGVKADTRKIRVMNALDSVGLADLAHKRPGQMSGGQRQRVSIARALAKQPRVILADEPTASLDQNTGQSVMNLMLKINADTGTSFLIASHDSMVMALAQKTIRMRDGQIVDEERKP